MCYDINMNQTPCYHVHTAEGATYGVAATKAKDALLFVQQRIMSEEPGVDRPTTAKRVARWDAEYGTVLRYT